MTDANRLRAIVVDDDPVLRQVLARALDGLGFECIQYECGEDAVAEIAELAPSLALVDIEMPGIDGFETTRRIREQLGDRIAILVATGHNDREIVEQAFEAGASDFVDKPFDWTLLEHRIRFLMRAHTAFTDLVRNERRLAQAQQLARIGHWEWREEDDALVCSEEAARLFGLGDGAPASIGVLLDTVHVEERRAVSQAYAQAMGGAAVALNHRILRDGETFIVRQQLQPVKGQNDQLLGFQATIQDITERERAAEQIRNLSYHDALTGLPNDRMLHEHIEDLAAIALDTQSRFAVLRLSIDRFDDLTTTIGPRFRDELVIELAARIDLQLKRKRRDGGIGAGADSKSNLTLGRLGNEHFAVVVRDTHGEQTAQLAAADILDIVRAPFMIEGRALNLTVSVGIALCPDDGQDVFSLIHSAEMALAEAQSHCPGTYRLANPKDQQKHERRLQIELALRDALATDERVIAAYQPQWSPQTGEIEGVELLSRWTDPELGVVSPGEFVPIAEDTGLITELSRWTVRAACRQLAEWRDAGIHPLRVSINVSPRFVETEEALGFVRAQIQEFGVDPCLLECEFTETAMVANHDAMQTFAAGLREMGVRTALDDFGTGYSSLQHLVAFPLDCVKIDLSFVMRLEEDHAARAICSTLLAMARELELEVVAEGVETVGQMKFLADHGCDLLQGFLLSPAVPAPRCIEMRDQRAGTKVK